ncbi:hypothetical protein, partial [uncultured Anaerococcus sp.]|uniref:hypothetical protein n=1 Tax=uncultured Anaerococcus sp. TaxID=293428 RepID=UPI00261CA09B
RLVWLYQTLLDGFYLSYAKSLKSQYKYNLKQGLLHTKWFAVGKHIFPREGSPGGGNGRGFKGDPIVGTCETFPRGPPYYEDLTVSRIIIYNS